MYPCFMIIHMKTDRFKVLWIKLWKLWLILFLKYQNARRILYSNYDVGVEKVFCPLIPTDFSVLCVPKILNHSKFALIGLFSHVLRVPKLSNCM